MVPDSIGHGVGGNLIRRGISWAKQNSFEVIQTTADPNAQGFYQQFGFVKVADYPSTSIPRRVLPRMELCLASFVE